MRKLFLSLLLCSTACTSNQEKTDMPQQPSAGAEVAADAEANALIQEQLATLKPLIIDNGKQWYNASITGTDEAFAASQKAEDALNAVLADPQRFAKIKAMRAKKIADPLVARQIEVLYLSMLGKQVAPDLLGKITALQKEVEQAFNTYRGTVAGKKVTQNEIDDLLRDSTDSKKLQEAWQAQKGVGVIVAPKLAELAKLRNQVAKQLGFRDFYALRLAESEQDEQQLLALFDELDKLTREPFLAAKAEVDRRLAKRLGIEVAALRPWHYQNPFFQEPPDVFKTGLDPMYAKQDTLALCRKFYNGIGLEVDDIIKRSDLYEKEGKTPHAFAIDVDREGDVRVLANIVPGLRWQGTMIHELGHAVYDKYVDHELPWLLREASHPLTTEGLAMMLDRQVANPAWAFDMGAVSDADRDAAMAEAKAYLAFAPLQFSRWTQVMLRFERAMYADPDQDLNKLWWDLVEKYQGLTRPEGRNAPDYASKIHLVVAPVYYHNYMMGDLFGAQVHEWLAAGVGKKPKELTYVNEPKVGEMLKEMFGLGTRYPWNELVKELTGKELSPEAYSRRFAEG